MIHFYSVTDQMALDGLFAIECVLEIRDDTGWSRWSFYAERGEW